jgi:hypothetical protein
MITEPKTEIHELEKAQLLTPMTTPTSPSHSQKGTEIKKSFSSAFSSLDNAFAKGFDKIKQTLDVSDDLSQCEEWEVSSIKSGMSDEDDDFLVIGLTNMKETAAFRHRRHESNASGSDAKDIDEGSLTTLNMSHILNPLRNKVRKRILEKFFMAAQCMPGDGRDRPYTTTRERDVQCPAVT